MARYSTTPITKDLEGTRMYKTVKYPIIPRNGNDMYVISTDGDRYDRLSLRYYNDTSLWWVISTANAEYPQNSLFPPVGVQLRIPGNLEAILRAYNNLNK